ncbi:phosphate ABC transporter permease PstA [Nocardioides sp. Kera G14]|uniref:phosphate ABC transporter permease PstA n=1 Tax=Nocardioides sp. Kera G14 TaxID=2884264 RepID=UPI001D12B333|nr:phosphate ABC transporter permease PstA [Nocardioides sp. Kera G14]UDY23001.1 phosphate ABC transporter permease PstA [Nocardioides sp. Kera G14]
MTATLSPSTTTTHTHIPAKADGHPAPRTNLGQLPADERFLTWGARIAALLFAWVVVDRLLPIHGLGWFVVVYGVTNLLILVVGTAMTNNNVRVADRVAQWFVSAGTLIVLVSLASVLIYVVARGWSALIHLNFFTDDMTGAGTKAPLDQGGIIHAIIGSIEELALAAVIALPLGVGTAVFMNEVGGGFARVVRTVVEAMTALPDILAGLFIYTVWIIAFGFPRSGLAASLALSVMMLPIIARASDVVLRVVPGTLREASLALGASRWSTVWNVVLPTARPGLATALILAIARGIGETAPVLITSGNAPFVHLNPTSGVMNSLPIFIFASARSGIDVQIQRAFGASTVLLVLVLGLFIVARIVARPPSGKPSLLRRLMKAARPTPTKPHHQPAPDEETP